MTPASALVGSDLGRRVRHRREELGLGLGELAARSGMDATFLAYLERTPVPSLAGSDLDRLARALETTPGFLLGAEATQPPGHGRPVRRPEVRDLDKNEAVALLAKGGVGRVVFDDGRRLAALPVNFAVEGGEIAFCAGARLAASLAATDRVSFEVDRLDEVTGEAWSVLVAGPVRTSEDGGELARLSSLGAEPWVGRDGLTSAVWVTLDEVTGRALRARVGGRR